VTFQDWQPRPTDSLDGAGIGQLRPVEPSLGSVVLRSVDVGNLDGGNAAVLRLHTPRNPGDDPNASAAGPAGGRSAQHLRADGGVLAREPAPTTELQGAPPKIVQLGARPIAGRTGSRQPWSQSKHGQPAQQQHRTAQQQHWLHAHQQRISGRSSSPIQLLSRAELTGFQHKVRRQFSAPPTGPDPAAQRGQHYRSALTRPSPRLRTQHTSISRTKIYPKLTSTTRNLQQQFEFRQFPDDQLMMQLNKSTNQSINQSNNQVYKFNLPSAV
jgi:hypothetical protein